MMLKCVPCFMMMLVTLSMSLQTHADSPQAQEQVFWDKEPIPYALLIQPYAKQANQKITLNMGMHDSYPAAKVDVEVLVAQGFSASIIKVADQNGQLFFVLIHGEYADAEEANAAKQRAQAILFRNIQLVLLPEK